MKTSIIIVNYNSQPALDACLKSLHANTAGPMEIIVVDNHSNDGSIDYLRKTKNPALRVISNESNLGFTKACNQGIKIAQGDILVTMNPDVLVPQGWSERMAWHLRNNPQTLIVGPKGIGIGGRQSPGMLCYPSNPTAAARKFAAIYHRKSEPVKFLIGCLIMFDRWMIKKIGGFDEGMPLGADDFDLSLRVRKAGYQLRVACDVLVHHLVHFSFNHSNPNETKRLEEVSYHRFYDKWSAELDRYGWNGLFEDPTPIFPGDPL